MPHAIFGTHYTKKMTCYLPEIKTNLASYIFLSLLEIIRDNSSHLLSAFHVPGTARFFDYTGSMLTAVEGSYY